MLSPDEITAPTTSGSFIERPCQTLVFKLLLEARTHGLVFLTLAVALENGAVVPDDLHKHRHGVHPPLLFRSVDPTHVNRGLVIHVGLANSALQAKSGTVIA